MIIRSVPDSVSLNLGRTECLGLTALHRAHQFQLMRQRTFLKYSAMSNVSVLHSRRPGSGPTTAWPRGCGKALRTPQKGGPSVQSRQWRGFRACRNRKSRLTLGSGPGMRWTSESVVRVSRPSQSSKSVVQVGCPSRPSQPSESVARVDRPSSQQSEFKLVVWVRHPKTPSVSIIRVN
jgi:hypothetical protein